MKWLYRFFGFVFFGLLLWSAGCDDVQDSPQPGFVRIVLQADPSDTILVERSDTFTVTTKYPAIFMMKVFQGRIYKDSNFAVLYRTPTSYRQEDVLYNVLRLDTLSGAYKKYVVFESQVPPNSYRRFEFGLSPSKDDFLKVIALNGKTFENPVELQPGSNPLIGFDESFTVESGRTTEIEVQFSPFKSVSRYRDLYYCNRVLKVVGITYY